MANRSPHSLQTTTLITIDFLTGAFSLTLRILRAVPLNPVAPTTVAPLAGARGRNNHHGCRRVHRRRNADRVARHYRPWDALH